MRGKNVTNSEIPKKNSVREGPKNKVNSDTFKKIQVFQTEKVLWDLENCVF